MADTRTGPSLLVAATAIALVGGLLVGLAVGGIGISAPDAPDATPTQPSEADVVAFESQSDFEEYLAERRSNEGVYMGRSVQMSAEPAAATATAAEVDAGGGDGASSAPERHSETNVQELGIDEPDVLKTDGRSAFYVNGHAGAFVGGPDVARIAPRSGILHVLDVSSPADPRQIANVSATGRLLLANDTLLVLSNEEITAYDVSDPENPTETWSRDVNGRVVTARLSNGTVYTVVRERVSVEDPCPVRPLSGVEVACSDVYHSTRPTASVDSTTTVLTIDPTTGDVHDEVGFLASWTSATYMSQDSLYVTYPVSVQRGAFRLEFLLTEVRDRFDARTVDRLERLQGYELSDSAVAVETQHILRQWYDSLSDEERKRAQEELGEAYRDYVDEHKRELQRTGIVRVDVSDPGSLSVAAVGEVPGSPLNQFSLDEHDGHLRIATTVAPSWGIDSVNDVYVLDEDLEVTGSVQGMGVTERIYSVRFVGDEGYVVTFRRIDPFHVLDLSDPSNPTLEGELKLPGFSSYLHPVGEDRILGIGEENGTVKAVMFDVSDPTDPTIGSEVRLDDRWSEIRSTHHAFLQDEKHEVVFIPGSNGGHVLSYADGLETVTTVDTEGQARRAMYVDDYLYVFSNGGLVVVDETTWETETRLTFESRSDEPPERTPTRTAAERDD